MKAIFRNYCGKKDFLRVRDFLKEILFAHGKPCTWGIERWNWSRFHPSVFCEADPDATSRRIAYWERCVGIWENESGRILGVVNTEIPEPSGEFFVQRIPGCDEILDGMLSWAESTFADTGTLFVRLPIYEHDGALHKAATARGYEKTGDSLEHWAQRPIGDMPAPRLPEGFSILSMEEGGNVAERCKVQGRGFNHLSPDEWMKPLEFAEVQKAPDYRAELDLVACAPDMSYAACCLVWYDDFNHVAFFEPVCTDPAYRKLGLGRELLFEGIRRAAALGATKVFVGSSQEFYRKAGFTMELALNYWRKKII